MKQYNESSPLGRFLRETRMNVGMNLEDFGKAVGGVSKTLISRWERGLNTPSTRHLHQIAANLNIDVKHLIALSSPTSDDKDSNELFYFFTNNNAPTYKGKPLEADEIAAVKSMLEIIIKNKA